MYARQRCMTAQRDLSVAELDLVTAMTICQKARVEGSVVICLFPPQSHRVTEKTLNRQEPEGEEFAKQLGFSVSR